VDRECRADPNVCVINELQGSRIGVANAEIRFPLIRQLAFGFAPLGLPPIEGFAFGDAGTAWRSGATPVLERGLRENPIDCLLEPGQDPNGLPDGCTRRGIYTSVGVGARVNIFGLMVLEAAYVNPLDRPRGWHWQLSLQPGY
jgi:hypothetical protein